MDPLTSMAASGLRSNLESLDLIANNLANVQTTAFKADSEFYSLYTASEAVEAGAYDMPMPVIERSWTDYSQGDLHETGIPTDLAISGAGFFTVEGPDGPLYTRNGAFQLNPAGRLVTSDGYPLVGSDGRPVQLDPNQPQVLTPEGQFLQAGAVVATMRPVSFKALTALSKRGSSIYQFNGVPTDIVAAPGVFLQGKLENSNASVAGSAVRMVEVLRNFEMLQKAILIGVDMNTASIQATSKSGT